MKLLISCICACLIFTSCIFSKKDAKKESTKDQIQVNKPVLNPEQNQDRDSGQDSEPFPHDVVEDKNSPFYFDESKVSVHFSPQLEEERRVDKKVFGFISNAKRSIDLALYNISSGKPYLFVWEKLKEKAQAGVRVRILLDKNILKESGSNKAKIRALTQINGEKVTNVQVRVVPFSNHHKFGIIDGPAYQNLDDEQYNDSKVLSGSGNWTNRSIVKYDEDFVVFKKAPRVVNSFQREFNNLWAHSSRGKAKDFNPEEIGPQNENIPEGSPVPVFTSSNLRFKKRDRLSVTVRKQDGRNISGKDGVATRRIIKAIQGATKSVYIAATRMLHPEIYTALRKKKEENPKLEIKMLTDLNEFHFLTSRKLYKETDYNPYNLKVDPETNRYVFECNKVEEYVKLYGKNSDFRKGFKLFGGRRRPNQFIDECMRKIGQVRYKVYLPYWMHGLPATQIMHLKFIIVDKKSVYTGSFNLSHTSELGNLENLMRLEGSYVVKSYLKKFNNSFNYGRVNPVKFELEYKDLKDGPVKLEVCRKGFGPYALSYEETRDLFYRLRSYDYCAKKRD